MAVGSISTSAGEEPFAERWDGRRWSIQYPPSLGIGTPMGVSCTSATACTAVGGSFVWRWDGTRWTGQSINPLAQVAGELNAVSCTSSISCAAVGAKGANRTTAVRWDGMNWTVESTPHLGHDATLAGVSCTAASACMAVGNYYTTTGQPLALAWSGHRWFRQGTPGTSDDILKAVSCVSRTSCTAVGFDFVGGDFNYPVAERWNGHRWSRQILPHIADAPNTELVAVSCTSGSVCTAVGDSENGNLPLIEQSTLRPPPVCRDPDRDHDCD